MAMLVIMGNRVLSQKEGESLQAFCDRINIWEESQPETSQPSTRLIDQKFSQADLSQSINPCDGCRRGLPAINGVHRGPGEWDVQGCTKGRYD